MSDTALKRLVNFCSYWTSLWILRRYDREIVNDLMRVVSGVRIMLNEYGNSSNITEIIYDSQFWYKVEKSWYRSCIRYRGCPDLFGSDRIQIKNEIFRDVFYDFDHILIARNGIFIIEMLKGNGDLCIENKDQWFWEEDGKRKGANNLRKWFRRREGLLRSIVPEDVPIISICCVENDEGSISGAETTGLNIIKLEDTGRFIMEYPSDREFPKEKLEGLAEEILEYQTRWANWFS